MYNNKCIISLDKENSEDFASEFLEHLIMFFMQCDVYSGFKPLNNVEYSIILNVYPYYCNTDKIKIS